MPWYRKEQPTPFDNNAIAGLTFLNGDVAAAIYQQSWAEGKKYPMISFPSGLSRELWDSAYPGGIVHIFGGLELLRVSSRDEAFASASEFAVDRGYQVTTLGSHSLTIIHPQSHRGYWLDYDPETNELRDVLYFSQGEAELLDGESRAVLPELYSQESRGLAAVAPLKFFTPDAQWTWYPSEFDGEDIFFGLVSGLETELGYFSLSELESIRGPLGLPVERDLYFDPQTLRALRDWHEQ